MNFLINVILGLIILTVGFFSGIFVTVRGFKVLEIIETTKEIPNRMNLEEWR